MDKRDQYFKLYDKFSKILLRYNPCKWVGNTCVINRENKTINGCCPNCHLNTSVGCSIQSLGCKMFLCETAFQNLPSDIKKRWRKMKLEAENSFTSVDLAFKKSI